MKVYCKQPFQAEQFDTNRLTDFLGKYPIKILPVSFIENRFTETYVLNTPQGYIGSLSRMWRNLVLGEDESMNNGCKLVFKKDVLARMGKPVQPRR
ncbi:hypothetical protein [Lactiplantibacillus plantarum]|uniref:hypothetical protein n=1 Tax=Lactiplantibacillus plantarum TaxID=1590 RepID=UPI002021157D|nr:hypothetical protein [Lactiplantibacillus plantarum]